MLRGTTEGGGMSITAEPQASCSWDWYYYINILTKLQFHIQHKGSGEALQE